MVYAIEPQRGDPWQIAVYDVDDGTRRFYSDVSSPDAPTVFLDQAQELVVFGRVGGAWFYADLESLTPVPLSGAASVRREGGLVLVREETTTAFRPGRPEWTVVASELLGTDIVSDPSGRLLHHLIEANPTYGDSVVRVSRIENDRLTPLIELQGPSGTVLWKPDSRVLVRTRCTQVGVCNELCHVDLDGDRVERCLISDGSAELRFSPTGRYLLALPPGASRFLEVFDTSQEPWTRSQPGLESNDYALLSLRAYRSDVFYLEDFNELFYFDLRDGFPGQMRSANLFTALSRQDTGPLALLNGASGDAGLANGTLLSSFNVDLPDTTASLRDESLNVYASDIQWSSDGDWAVFLGGDGASAELGHFIIDARDEGAPVRLGTESTTTFSDWIFR